MHLIAIKPDGVQHSLVGKIKCFEQKGFCLIAMKLIQASEDLLKEHYIDLRDHTFSASLVKYMQSGPVVAMKHHSNKKHKNSCSPLKGHL
uniref:nucleoside-diphosphate kinase n=2 Tax=Ursus TaxID=9639 RepID=A0A452TUK1_URSMA